MHGPAMAAENRPGEQRAADGDDALLVRADANLDAPGAGDPGEARQDLQVHARRLGVRGTERSGGARRCDGRGDGLEGLGGGGVTAAPAPAATGAAAGRRSAAPVAGRSRAKGAE